MYLHSLFPFFGLSPSLSSLHGATNAIPDVLGVQRSFSSLALAGPHVMRSVPKGDPAGRPNLATRLEITSPVNNTLFCAKEGDKHQSGYAHFTNAVGQEDKHMFWTLFEAKSKPEDAPVLLYFGGGPGTSGMTVPFSGQGHCKVVSGSDGNGTAVPSEYPWTDFAHILAVDYPVGTGFSYGDQASLRNSSERAAWDLDDLLQAFWKANPQLAKNQFAIGSGSYGGTYIPNLVNVIRQRNLESMGAGNASRLYKMPDTVMISNPYGDPVAIQRYAHVIQCDDMGYFNASVCEDIVRSTPACLDAFQLAEEQPTIHNKVQAMEDCAGLSPWERDVSGRNPADVRQKCNIENINECFPSFAWMENTMNDPRIREAFGVPENVTYKFIATEEIGIPFAMNGDLSQRAYKLLTPAVDEGMRLLVYNGVDDAICPSRATESWLRLLQSKYQSDFRGAPEIEWSGVGSFYSVGDGGAGQLAFVKIQRAGHFVIGQQPKATRHLAEKWLRNEKFA